MKQAVSWFASNSVAANLLMLVIVGGGLLTLPRITEEVFPEFSSEMIRISVPYPGAAPEEVEDAVCIKIEERIQSLEGVKQIVSSASEGVGIVTVELLEGTDVREALDDIKSRVDAIDTFPEETEKPVIQEIIIKRQVVNVAVSGNADEMTLKHLAEEVRDEIASLPGVTQVELANARPYEISVEVSEEALRRHGLTFDEVARAVRLSSLDLPAGSVRTEGGEILLRTKGQAYVGAEFEKLILVSNRGGTRLLLGDVATVVDAFAETDQSARFDGKPSVLVQVFRVGDQSALDIADAVHEYVDAAQHRMPEGIRLVTWQDDSKVLRSRLELLYRNGRAGLILVVIILALFLRLSLSFWVSIGIPISFLGSLWLMPGLDISINLMSLFAFIVVLGIVVDDAIVVGENIYSHYEQGKSGLQAAVDGAQEMVIPVTFAVLTTVAAFSPLLQVSGSTGKIMRVIPLIVIPTLLFSLVESLLVLPSHLSHLRHHSGEGARGGVLGIWYRFQNGFTASLKWFINRVYGPGLRSALRWRYLTTACGVAILILTIGLVGGGGIQFTFLPDVEADNVVALLTMPQGTPASKTGEAVRRLEKSLEKLRQEIDSATAAETPSVFRHVLASVGDQPFRTAQSQSAGAVGQSFNGAQLGEVNVELAPSEQRPLNSTEIANRWRDLTGPIPDAVELTFSSSLFSSGDPIDVQLSGADLEQLQAAAQKLKQALTQYPGVYDIADSFRAGKEEIKLNIRPAAETLGLTLSDLARQVRQAFYGEEAQRIQRGRDEVKVMVRYPYTDRRSIGDLEQMRIRTAAGGQVPFSTVASYQRGRGYASIRRVDRNRAINVTAKVNENKNNANDILANLEESGLPELIAEYQGVRYSLEGQQREQRDTIGGLVNGFLVALLLIYALLAIPLKSYLQPLLIMSAIPFGLVGAVLGHIVLGIDLTVLSMFGIVAMAGVVVNDSLVLVDYINRKRIEGVPVNQSVSESGAARFRPILLTSLTTFAGLTPLLLEKSLQAQFLIPMAVSLAFGVIFSTFITLLLVPAGYLILEDLKALPAHLFGRKPEVEPDTRAGKGELA